MSQIITNAFSRYWQECLATQVPVVLDEFVLANVPDLDPAAPIDPASGLPPAGQIVHRHKVDQRGRINNDSVAYTIVMDTTVGDFSFNAMYLINKATGMVGMIVHKGLETKLKTNEAAGQTGNSLVKSMLMEYDRAAEATATHVDASTWQIDYAARLRGMDDDLRLQALQFFGPATFYGDGFNLVNESGVYKVQPGVAYVGGLRAELNEVKKITPGAKPVGLWLDIYRAGSLLDAWVNHFTLTLSVPDMVDNLDSNGYQHHVAKVAIINADGSVTDVRRKRTIELAGDVSGKGILEDAQGVTIAVEIKDGSHRHKWGELDQVPATASRWPSYEEVTDKPDLAATNHIHLGSATNPINLGKEDLNNIINPGFYAQGSDQNTSLDRHYPAELSGSLLVTTGAGIQQRYHAYNSSLIWTRAKFESQEFTPWVMEYNTQNKPKPDDIGAMKDGGSYNSVTMRNWFKSIGNTGWYNETYGGGISMDDAIWVRVIGGKKFYISAKESDALMVDGGILAKGQIVENGQRVYSPYNQPHYSHLHNAAQGNADLVAGGWGQIGTYMFAQIHPHLVGDCGVGALIEGYALRPCSVDIELDDIHDVPMPGTWKCMGRAKLNINGETDWAAAKTLWFRVA
ncbi:phage tail protein [Aeromonas veronii]